jgi:hypothetical protein
MVLLVAFRKIAYGDYQLRHVSPSVRTEQLRMDVNKILFEDF